MKHYHSQKAILNYLDEHDGEFTGKTEDLANAIGYKLSTTKDALKKLYRSAYIDIEDYMQCFKITKREYNPSLAKMRRDEYWVWMMFSIPFYNRKL